MSDQRPEVFDVGLVDCDLVKYKSAFSAEKTIYHLYDESDELVETFRSARDCANYLEELEEFFGQSTEGYRRESEKIIGDEEQAINACDLILKHIQKNCPAKEYKYYLTGNDTYRPSIATLHKYKGCRDKMEKPKWIDSVTKHLIKEYGAVPVDYIECDDTLTVGLGAYKKKGKTAVAINLDKDVLQQEGWHYNWDKDEFLYVDYWEGLVWTYTQALAGDMSVDNYEGIPRVGKVKARKILKDCTTEREMYEAAVDAYRNHFGDEYTYKSWDDKEMTKTAEELFLENMKLAYILKEKDKFYQVPEKE